jgi:hypothetical protein
MCCNNHKKITAKHLKSHWGLWSMNVFIKCLHSNNHKTSQNANLSSNKKKKYWHFITVEVLVSSPGSERSCITQISILHLSMIFLLVFWTWSDRVLFLPFYSNKFTEPWASFELSAKHYYQQTSLESVTIWN